MSNIRDRFLSAGELFIMAKSGAPLPTEGYLVSAAYDLYLQLPIDKTPVEEFISRALTHYDEKTPDNLVLLLCTSNGYYISEEYLLFEDEASAKEECEETDYFEYYDIANQEWKAP